MKKIEIYTKFCVKQTMKPSWEKLQKWAGENHLELKINRTIYSQDFHKFATEIMGTEDYPPFLIYRNKAVPVTTFINNLEKKEKNDDLRAGTVKKSPKKTTRKTKASKVKEEVEE